MAERYKLPAEWGGAEIEGFPTDDGLWVDVVVGPVASTLPRVLLTPVKSPTPPEPEPGAYLIGETICVRVHWKRSDPWCIVTEPDVVWTDIEWDTWPGLMEFFGPDVTITRLVPERVETVKLPWNGKSEGGRVVSVYPDRSYRGTDPLIRLDVNGENTLAFSPETAAEIGRAILAASRAES